MCCSKARSRNATPPTSDAPCRLLATWAPPNAWSSLAQRHAQSRTDAQRHVRDTSTMRPSPGSLTEEDGRCYFAQLMSAVRAHHAQRRDLSSTACPCPVHASCRRCSTCTTRASYTATSSSRMCCLITPTTARPPRVCTLCGSTRTIPKRLHNTLLWLTLPRLHAAAHSCSSALRSATLASPTSFGASAARLCGVQRERLKGAPPPNSLGSLKLYRCASSSRRFVAQSRTPHLTCSSVAATTARRRTTDSCGICSEPRASRELPIGAATDIWSCGICLFGCLAGFFPLDGACYRRDIVEPRLGPLCRCRIVTLPR